MPDSRDDSLDDSRDDSRDDVANVAVAAPPSSDPDILHWEFNEGSGTTIGATVGGAGTTNGTWGTGIVGSNCLTFNGTTHYGQSDAAVAFGSNIITVACWVKWTNAGAATTETIFESSATYVSNDDAFRAQINAGELAAGIQSGVGGPGLYRQERMASAPSDGKWHHLAIVLDNSTTAGDVKIYLNAQLQTEDIALNSKDQSGNLGTYKINIGARDGGASLFLDGSIDDLRIYGSELTSAQILDLVKLGSGFLLDVDGDPVLDVNDELIFDV